MIRGFAGIRVMRALNRNVEWTFNPSRNSLGRRKLRRGPMTTVWIYDDTNKEVGDADHLKVFATPELADEWFKENDPQALLLDMRSSKNEARSRC
jgi:hypothetical protein